MICASSDLACVAQPEVPVAPCAHEWKPASGWTGRYRCRHCWVLAYRSAACETDIADGPLSKDDKYSRDERLIPYCCQVCHGGAVIYGGSHSTPQYRGKQFCRAHKDAFDLALAKKGRCQERPTRRHREVSTRWVNRCSPVGVAASAAKA